MYIYIKKIKIRIKILFLFHDLHLVALKSPGCAVYSLLGNHELLKEDSCLFIHYKGIKEYGERAIAAMTKELIQLDEGAVKDKPVIEAIDYNTLTDGDKKKALDAVNIIELKRVLMYCSLRYSIPFSDGSTALILI